MEGTKQKPYSEMTIGELKELAKKGDVKAHNNLALCFEYGEGVRKSYKKAVEWSWYTKAAEQGFSIAQNNLAMCYKEGFGVEKDLAKALEWAIKAADNGDEEARNTVLEIQQEMREGLLSCAENDLTLR